MKVQAVKDKIFVQVIKEELKTPGGIVIPEGVRQLPQKTGVVLSVGEEVKEIKEGDILMFHQQAGQIALIESVEYRILMYNEIYAVVNE